MTTRIERHNAGQAEPRASLTRPLLAASLLALALVAGTTGAEAASSTAVSLGSSSNPALPGTPVIWTAVVTAFGDGTATGQVNFDADYANYAHFYASPYVAVGASRTLATGAEHTCAVTSAGGVQCWGNNNVGQLGTGTMTASPLPTDVLGLDRRIAAVAAGAWHSCALTTTGGVICWGDNLNGQLGNGKTTIATAPVDVVGLTSGVVAIAAGSFHTCALTDTGGVKCWGSNHYGQLGDGGTTDRTTPVDVIGLTGGVRAITAGSGHSCAVIDDDTAKCWGANWLGQLGKGNTSSQPSPVPTTVTGLNPGVSMISAGGNTTCAVVSGGAQCWGNGRDGQLGNGASLIYKTTPVAVSNLTEDLATIAVGYTHVCAVTATGRTWCWGLNSAGELGDGTTVESNIPVAVTALGTETISVAVSNSAYAINSISEHSCAVLVGGQIRCWGVGNAGRLGVGTTDNSATPLALTSPLAAVASGTWTAVSGLSPGDHTISASFLGDETHGGSFSGAQIQTIGALTSSVSLVSSKTAPVYGEAVTFTAEVVTSRATPTGSITFTLDDVTIGPAVALVSGRAELAVPSLSAGYHTVRATYGGDDTHRASVSRTIVQKVDRGTTAISLTPTTSTISAGASVTFTATVTTAAPSTGSPNGGLVYFRLGSTDLGYDVVSGGTASLTLLGFPLGSTQITARFHETTDLAESTSGAATVTVDPRSGAEFRANTRTLGSQQLPAVATLTGGGYVVVWASKDQDGSSWGIYGQRYKADSSKDGGEFRVNTATSNAQSWPSIAATGDGGFVVAWSGSNARASTGIWAQRWSATGGRLGGQFRVDTTAGTHQTGPSVAASPTGGFLVTWISNTATGASFDVRSQLYGATGKKVGREVRVNTRALPVLTSASSATALDGGTWAIAWTYAAKAGAKPIVVARRLTAAGVGNGGEIAVTSATFAQSDPVATRLKGQGFLVAWVSQGQDGSGKGIYAQGFDLTGVRLGSTILVNQTITSDQSEPTLASLSGGGFFAEWTSAGQDGSSNGVYGRLFNWSVTPIADEVRLNTTTYSSQSQPAVAAFSDTDLVAVWTSVGTDKGLEGVYGQRFRVP